MGKYRGSAGREIIDRAKADISRAGTEMSLMAEWGQYPNEYRASVRREKTSVVRVARMEAEQDFSEWAKAQRLDATKRLNATKLGTAAEESRRVAEELRIGRMVDSARAAGNAREVAADLTYRANVAYGQSNEDEAFVLARAANELGDHERSAEIIESVSFTRTLADPDKAKAMRDLQDVDVVEAAFKRDVTHAVAAAYQEGVKLARVLGDQQAEAELRRDASEIERTSKVAAWDASVKEGVPFSAPVGDGTATEAELYAMQRGANPKIGRQDSFEADSPQRTVEAPTDGDA